MSEWTILEGRAISADAGGSWGGSYSRSKRPKKRQTGTLIPLESEVIASEDPLLDRYLALKGAYKRKPDGKPKDPVEQEELLRKQGLTRSSRVNTLA